MANTLFEMMDQLTVFTRQTKQMTTVYDEKIRGFLQPALGVTNVMRDLMERMRPLTDIIERMRPTMELIERMKPNLEQAERVKALFEMPATLPVPMIRARGRALFSSTLTKAQRDAAKEIAESEGKTLEQYAAEQVLADVRRRRRKPSKPVDGFKPTK